MGDSAGMANDFHIYLDDADANWLRDLAKAEDRSASNMAGVLLKRAMKAGLVNGGDVDLKPRIGRPRSRVIADAEMSERRTGRLKAATEKAGMKR